MTTVDAVLDHPVRWPLLRMLALGRPVRTNLVVAVLAGATAVGAGIALLACSGFLLARASQHPNIVALSIAVVAVRALGITRGLSRYVERLAGHDAALRVLADLRGSVYARLERLSPSVLGRLRGGDLVTRFVADIDAVQDLFIRGIAPPLVAALVGGLTVAFVVAISVPGGLVLAAGLGIAGLGLPSIAALMTRRTAAHQSALRAELSVVTVDLVDGAAELTALGASGQLLDRLDQVDTHITRLSRRSAAANAVGVGGAALVAGLTLFGVLLSGVAAAHSGSLGTVPLAVVVLTAIAAFELTATLPAAAVALHSVRASARRVLEVVDAPAAIAAPEQVVTVPAGQLEIELRAVTLTYPGASTPALRDLDLKLMVGHRIGVVGASGSGKSTLAAVLLRLVDIDAGHYLLGGVDVSDLDPDDVRRVVSGCPADPHIFDSTIRANLLLAQPGASATQLAETIAAVRLDGWIAGLSDGLDTAVGVHGVAMSGGQRQRLSIARALLADPQVLVLDEPTVHLDAETADAVMSDLLAATAGRTTVLITHDRRGLDSMDEVITLAGGVVVPELQVAVSA